MNINLIGLANTTSYGVITNNLLKELSKNHNIALFPTIDNPQGIEVTQENNQILQTSFNNRNYFDGNAPSIKIWHHEWNHQMFPAGKGKKYQYTIFELDQFSNAGRNYLNYLDGIIVSSHWSKKIIKNNGIDAPTFVIPLGIDSVPKKVNRQDNITKYIFSGKFEIRKSILELLDCFEKAFTIEDNVELHLICANRLLPQKEQEKWKNIFKYTTLSNKIKVYDWIPDNSEVYRIFSECDCGVFLNKAEGFNLPLAECLKSGLQIIALNYSAPTEYLSSNNAMLIEPTEYNIAFDGYFFTEQTNPNNGQWAILTEDNKEQCVEYMRMIYKKRQAGEDLTNYEGIRTAEKFSWQATAEKLLKVISND